MKIGDVFSDEDFDRSRSGASLVAGQGVAPDQQAEAVKLGNRYGLHPDTARASLDELRQRADMEDRRKALDAAPGLRAWVAEKPQNAPLADLRDMEVMGTLERKLRSFAEGLGGQFVGSGVTGIGQSLDALQRRAIEGVASLVLPKPRAGGAIDPASLHGPLMGEGWRQLGQPVKDYWREAGVPPAQKDFADDVVSGLGQMLGQMGLTALNPPAGVAMMFGQGADTMADKTAKDPGTQKNRDLATLGSGAWTAATEWASNKFILGMEKLPGIKMLDLKTPAFSRAARIGLAAAEEGGQEMAENVGQDWIRQTLTNPNAPIDFGDAGYQAGVGATVGAIVRSMVEGALHIRGRQNRQVFEALREADPELRKRLPEAYRDFVAKQTEGGGIENVFVPAERFVEYFQGVGLDPRAVASAIGAKNFQEAVAAGSDIVIPTADFAVHVATGEHFDGLAPDLKLHQGDLTQRELDALNASKAEREARLQAEFARMIEEGKQAQGINAAIESIVSDVEGQLVAAHMDPKAARDTAQVMRGAAVLASRAYPHLSPVEAAEKMWERYGLTVGRPMPDVLTKLKQADMSLDPLLNMIRAAQGPTEAQINGPSLVEFLRNAGGLLPVVELLDAQQARTPPGKKSLIQDSGLSLDEAAMKAVEAGFFAGTENGQLTETQLVEAITREVLGGSPEFSAAMQDQKAMETARTLAELADVLDQAGVDLKAMDNQTARERLMQFSQGQVLEQPYGNPAEHQTPLPEGTTEIDVDGVKRPALNSEGRPIHWSEEGTRNFWRWFGDSKVVDAEGRPLVVYHGTGKQYGNRGEVISGDVEAFDPSLSGKASKTGAPEGTFFFSNDPEVASSYTVSWRGDFSEQYRDNANVMPVYLKINKPAKINAKGENWREVLYKGEYGDVNEIAGRVQEAGKNDGVVVTKVKDHGVGKTSGKPANTYIAFSPTQIKSATGNRGTFSAGDANILYQGGGSKWYSPLSRAIEQMPEKVAGSTASVKSWLASNAGKLGVKKDEIQWSGITDWLDAQKGKVSKADIIAFLEQGGVKVKEVMLGNTESFEQYIARRGIEDRGGRAFAHGFELNGGMDAVRRDFDSLQDQKDKTKFSAYQLPGGKNYRELLLTLPQKEAPAPKTDVEARKQIFDAYADRINDLHERVSDPQLDQAARDDALVEMLLLQEERDRRAAGAGGEVYDPILEDPKFISGHFPATPNILAHIRFNARTDAQGRRVLFIEEIQSDWAQEGRKEGFAVSEKRSKEIDAIMAEVDAAGGIHKIDKGGKLYKLAREAADELVSGTIPQAPFVTDTKAWTALALKRMIRYAAENGYDAIAWTTGEQQVKRYPEALRQVADHIEWDSTSDGKGVSIYKNGARILEADVAKDGTLTRATVDKAQGKHLSEVIGKTMAQKVIDSTHGKIKGEEFTVGGEGMKGYYDSIVPQVAGDILKRFGGGKVEAVTLPAKDRDPGNGWGSTEEDVTGHPATKQPGFDITDAMRAKAMQGMPLFQGERGSLRIGADRRMAITLTENANLSTFLHETGHFYLEMMGDLAEDPAADQQVKDDYAALLGWLGVKSRAEIAVEHHEKFARANEAYLMEGNAPAPELRGVFQRFKAWLVGVYRDIANLDVKLNDDVRAVFDRIYATDQEIEAAKREVDVSSLFLDAAAAGMTEAEFAAYAGQIEKVSEEAQGTLMRRLMAEYQRGKEAWWKNERARTLEEVTAEVDAQPVYRAFAALVAGKTDDGTPVKLDRDDIGRRYGEGTLKQLPRGFQRIYASEGGLDIDTAAEMFGFPSGEAMLKSFLEMRPRKELIQAETDARMRERHGDLMTDGRIEEAARDALHNERRADVLATELRALNRKIREATPVVRFERQKAQQAQRENVAALDALPSPAMFRRAAAGMIDAMAVRDIRPHAYLLAGRKAAREAAAALARDQAGDAFSAKQRELLNHYLYLEAVKARTEADALRDYAKTFEGSRKREKLGKAGHDYLDQAEALLDRFEFSRISLTALQRRKSLREFIAEKEADGEIILIPEHLQDEARRINWREMSMGELRGLADALRNLDHLAGYKNKLLVKRKAMEFAAIKSELLASLESAFQEGTGDLDTFKENRTVGQSMNRFGRSLDGSLLKVEQLVEWMDGGRIDGPWARYFFDQADDAQAREYDLHKAVTARLMALADQMGPQWRASMMDKTEVVLPGIVGPLSRYRLISMALNTGNATNFQRLTQGMGWSEDQVRNALERLTAQDWTYVQGVWDTLETLWPDIAALQERVAGVPPPKVEAREVVTPHGTFRGGYFPLVYDPAKSNAGEKQANAAESVAQFMSQGYGRANTDRGATKARIENFAAPLMIDFEAVLTDHLPKVIKDISHREAALGLNKLLHDKEIKAALIDRIGMDRYQLLTGWEQTLIQDRADAFHRQFAAAHWSLSRLRANTSVVTMGWKLSTMLSQFAGFGPSWDLVGGKALTKGLMEFTAHPLKSLEMVAEKSGEMRHRMDTLDRDIKEALLATRGETGIVHAVRRTAFYLTGLADRMVSMPTWLGAYRKTLAEGGSEETAVRAGDRAVRLSQGAGGAKDLAAVQRNTEIMKLVTMYYTPFSALYARMRDAGHSTRGVRDLPRLVARSIGLVILPAVLGELLAGRPPDDDEDPVAWAARKALLYPAASIPIFRDLVQWQLDPLLASLSGGNLQHQPGYKFTPIISAVEKLARMPGHAFDAMTGDRPWDDTAWEMLEASGYLFGLPTAQPRITGEYLEDLFTGDASPETAAEMWHDLLFRRPPERAKR